METINDLFSTLGPFGLVSSVFVVVGLVLLLTKHEKRTVLFRAIGIISVCVGVFLGYYRIIAFSSPPVHDCFEDIECDVFIRAGQREGSPSNGYRFRESSTDGGVLYSRLPSCDVNVSTGVERQVSESIEAVLLDRNLTSHGLEAVLRSCIAPNSSCDRAEIHRGVTVSVLSCRLIATPDPSIKDVFLRLTTDTRNSP